MQDVSPPQERKFYSNARSKFLSSRVHHVDDDYAGDPEEAENYAHDPYEEEEDHQEAMNEKQASYQDGVPSASEEEEEEQEAVVPTFLAGISMDNIDKRPPPCYMYAKTVKWLFTNCK